jgi:lipoyl synthase
MTELSTRKIRAKEKLARIPIKIEPTTNALRKPDWIRVKLPTGSALSKVQKMVKDKHLVTVCEEASCPNLPECYSHGTATFMIMGSKCTRRCSFCDVGHGRPDPLDTAEPHNLATAIREMGLSYVVITSVDRDDLKDGGAQHFFDCIREVRVLNPGIKIEILVPDFRGRIELALKILVTQPADVFNHNLETIPRLYKQARPGSDYQGSLDLLLKHKQHLPQVATKSGLMLGLGETNQEIITVLEDLRAHQVDMLTVGQYLQPSEFHLPVARYVPPAEFNELAVIAKQLGFKQVASGPMVRSSYHADRQAAGETVV